MEIRSVSKANKKRACQFVKFCLDGEFIEPFKEYAQQFKDDNTFQNRIWKIFYFNGGKIFKMLPLEGRS